MGEIEIASKFISIVVLSEIAIQLIGVSLRYDIVKKLKPIIVIIVSFIYCFIENYNTLDILDILRKSIFEYASISMMTYEIIVKRVYGEIMNKLSSDEKPESI